MPIDSRERIGPAVAAVVTDVGHESAPTEWWPAPDELNPPLDEPSRQHWTPEPRGWRRTTRKRRHDRPTSDEPQPGSRAWMEQTAQLDSAMATARRYLSALNAQDHPACNAILVELACDRDGSMVKAFMALAAQALDFAHVLDQLGVLDGGSLQEYLDRSATSSIREPPATPAASSSGPISRVVIGMKKSL